MQLLGGLTHPSPIKDSDRARRKKKKRGLREKELKKRESLRKRLKEAAARLKKQQRADGVPKPISLKKPSAIERKSNKVLNRVLSQYNLIESKEQAEAREIVLQEINDLCKDWVTQSMARQNQSSNLGTCLCHSFGSYRLGVHSPGADIDLLVIGPRYVTREHFFSEFVEQLRGNERVQAILALREAYVPLVKFKFDGVDIDMVYACVGFEYIDPTKFDIFSDETLAHVDTKSVLSLNGARVTDTILRLVPDDDVFRKALRSIRFWAQRRGIYSNVMGYLGGVSWAILVAHICQLYPNANEGVIVLRFFTFFDLWKFSHQRPIKLCSVKENPDFNFANWDPDTNEREKFDIVPIITPVYPTMNSTHNVIASTHDRLKSEFHRARTILDKKKPKEPISEELWHRLFEQRDFFAEHKQYICVKTGSQHQDDQIVWRGFVESKLRSFAQRLNDGDVRVTAIPWPYPIAKTPAQLAALDATGTPQEQKLPYEHWFFVGLDIDRSALSQGQKINLAPAVQHFHKQLNFSAVANEREVNASIRCYTAKKLPAECRRPPGAPRWMARAEAVPLPSAPAAEPSEGSPPPDLMETPGPSPSHSTTSSSDGRGAVPPLQPPPLEKAEPELPSQALPPGCALARADEENRRRRKKEKKKRKRKREDSAKKDARRKKRKRQPRPGEEPRGGFEASGKLLLQEHRRKKKRRRRAAVVATPEAPAGLAPARRRRRKRDRRDAVPADDAPDGPESPRGERRTKRRVVVAETVSDVPSEPEVAYGSGPVDPEGYVRLESKGAPREDEGEAAGSLGDPRDGRDHHAPWVLVNGLAARFNMEKGREAFRTLRRLCKRAPEKRLYRDAEGKWDLDRLNRDIDAAALHTRAPVTIDLTDSEPSTSSSGKFAIGDVVNVRITKGRWSRAQVQAANPDGTYDVYFWTRNKTKERILVADMRATQDVSFGESKNKVVKLGNKAIAHLLEQPPD